MKGKVEVLDVDNLVPVPVGLRKLSDVLKSDVVKNILSQMSGHMFSLWLWNCQTFVVYLDMLKQVLGVIASPRYKL